MRDDDIVIRWTFDYNGGHMAGGARIPRADWNALSAEGRVLEVREAVGDAVIRALDVDWTITNARVAEPNQ